MPAYVDAPTRHGWRRGDVAPGHAPAACTGAHPIELSQFVAGAHAEAAHGERGVPPASAVAASKTTAAYGRWASVIGGGISAVSSIMPGSSSPLAADNLIEINSNDESHDDGCIQMSRALWVEGGWHPPAGDPVFPGVRR